MADSPMLRLLEAGGWAEFEDQFRQLAEWEWYPLVPAALAALDHSVLYASRMHGLGHIERTILQGGFCAMEAGLDQADTQLLLLACSYHDVGRQNDHVDDLHGHRSALRIGEITGRTGEDLRLLQGIVDAHSRRDSLLEETVQSYRPADPERALRLGLLLKDADGLDRVRLDDLDVRFLRRDSSRDRADLARAVFLRYQVAIGQKPEPFFSREMIAKYRREKGIVPEEP